MNIENGPNTDFLAVGESWKQDNLDNYVWPKLPRVWVSGKRSGKSRTTTYDLPALENFMSDSSAGERWEIGDAPAPVRDLDVQPVTVTVKGFSTKGVARVVPATGQTDRLKDAQTILPGLMAEAAINRERGLINQLVNTSEYGAARAFTGTQTLKMRDTTGDRQVINDIEDALDEIRDVQGSHQLEPYAFLTSRMASYMRRLPDYHGSGVGSNTASILGNSEFIKRFEDKHEVKCFVFKTAWNGAARGATRNIKRMGRTTSNNAFLSFVLVDARMDEFDLRTQTDNADYNPDGGLILAQEVEPYHTFEGSDNREAETHYVKDSFGYLNPRAGTTGVKFGLWFGTNIE